MHHCKCGQEITSANRFCTSCGAACGAQSAAIDTESPSTESKAKSDAIMLVKRAMHGDESVWGEIYEKTYRYAFFLAYKFLLSEEDAQDITQEAYMQAIRSIRQLYDAENFYAWLRSIIFSKCNDLVKKKKPMLLGDGVDDCLASNGMCEIRDDFIPDMALDNAETQRMILELVDALPYPQRQAVMFYYFDDMTVDQIASLAVCPIGTVKSRLNYARKQIREGVEEHAKKGVKLYGASTMPILSMLLKGQANTLQMPPSISAGLAPTIGQAPNAPALGRGMPHAPNGASQEGGASIANGLSSAPAPSAIANAPMLAKIIAGAILGTALVGGGVALLADNPGVGMVPMQTTAAPLATAEGTQMRQPIKEAIGEADGSDGLDMPDTAYYDFLDGYVKDSLINLAAKMKRSDYQAAYRLQKGERLQELFKDISFTGGFWFYPSDEMSVHVERGQDGECCVFLFHGNGDDADCYMSILDDSKWTYVFAKTSYSGGAANNQFVGYVIDYFYETEKLYTQSGSLVDGKAYGAVYEERDGNAIEADKPAWVDLWPAWPIR